LSAREFYFRTLGRMTDVLSGHSDTIVSESFERLGHLFRLMDLRTAAGDEPTIDLQRSGLPILREVISVCNDLDAAPGSDADAREAADIKAEMLDDMLVRRRVPSERLRKEMARALYRKTVDEERPSPGARPTVFQADANRSFVYADTRDARGNPGARATWDFWDGPSSRAIMIFADFRLEDPSALASEMPAVRSVASRFSATGFTPLSLASEIDDATLGLRLVKLSKITVGPFLSEAFSAVDDPIMDAMKAAEDIEDAWAIRWTVDHILAGGTKWVSGGLFKPQRPQQNFLVTLTDPDCAMRSVTSVERHVAMPHGMFQRLAGRRHECESLKTAAIHVLSGGDRLIENT
jgi:hypothetical protein